MAKLTTGTVNSAIIVILVILVLFSAYTSLVPEAQSAGAELNDTATCTTAGGTYNTSNTISCHSPTNTSVAVSYSAVPLSGLFNSGGVVFVVIMAALLIIIVRGTMNNKK